MRVKSNLKKAFAGGILSFIMLKYILRRTFYSLWVIFGVLLLTFALFHLASGDPAGAILGKNASPADIDSLRRELGGDLPFFFGTACKTEAFATPEVTSDKVTASRNFSASDIEAEIAYADGGSEIVPIPESTTRFTHLAQPGKKIVSCRFVRRQKSPWRSQFFRAVSELVVFKRTFPYVSFFNFGETLGTREPVADVLKRGVGPSLCLMLPIFVGELLGGILLALIAVACYGGWIDRALSFVAVLTMSLSYLVAIIFGQWFGGYYLEWFPVWGYDGVRSFFLPILIGIL